MSISSAKPTDPSHAVSAWSCPARWLPWIVFGACLLATYQLWRYGRRNAEQELRTESDFRVRVVASRIEQCMQAYAQVLRGEGGLFTHAGSVTRQKFRNYFERLPLEENYPSIQGLVFLRIVPRAQDEFVVLLPVIESEQDAVMVAEKILRAFSQPFELSGHSLCISSNTGIAIYPHRGGDKDMRIRNSGVAMYHAKGRGRNNVKIYRADMPGNL
ncbi:MAG: diguanylate cyclase [Gallionellaceae bacterium]|nr:MAG: diguanylate cyclase [Gallionellaceae bacterium]